MLKQMIALIAMNLSSLPARWGIATVVVLCLTGVAGVMVSMLAMAEGFEKSFSRAGRADRVVVLSMGETYESTSTISREQVPILLSAPGLARLPDGKPAASVERFTISALPLRDKNDGAGADGNLILRGLTPGVQQVRPEVRIIQGHLFKPGLRELVVGRAAQGQFLGLELGREINLSGVIWTVVGVFESGGSTLESEAWGDVEVVMSAYDQSSYSSITGLLESEGSFQTYKDAITSNPALSHSALLEPEYYAAQGGVLLASMRIVGYVVASIMALGALFAAINTMYASVESRSVEIATLRAIGFGGFPIVVSVLIESVLLCGAGALLGSSLAYALFNGYTVSTLNAASFSQLAFAFSVSPALLTQGALWACAIGLAGGLFPALRAARMPIATALRTT